MPETGDLRAYYAVRAKEYDRIYDKPERQHDLRQLEKWVPVQLSGRRVLEIACGTGYWTQFYSPVAEHVLATDGTGETLKLARSRCPSVGFKIADAYNLPAGLGSFNSAFAGFWLSHVPLQNMRAFLSGLQARLEPGSRILFIDNRYVEGSSTPLAETDMQGNTYQMRKLENGTAHRVLKNFPDEQALRDMITGLGTSPHYRAFEYYWGFAYDADA